MTHVMFSFFKYIHGEYSYCGWAVDVDVYEGQAFIRLKIDMGDGGGGRRQRWIEWTKNAFCRLLRGW